MNFAEKLALGAAGVFILICLAMCSEPAKPKEVKMECTCKQVEQ